MSLTDLCFANLHADLRTIKS